MIVNRKVYDDDLTWVLHTRDGHCSVFHGPRDFGRLKGWPITASYMRVFDGDYTKDW